MFRRAGGGEVHWHQDDTFLRCEPFPIVGLDCAGTGDHRQRMLARGRGRPRGLLTDALGWTRRTACLAHAPAYHSHPMTQPIEVAEAILVVIHGHLPHASFPNLSRRSRLAFTLHLMDARSQYARPIGCNSLRRVVVDILIRATANDT